MSSPIIFTVLACLIPFSTQVCTPDSCLYCMNDGSNKYCTACGNGKLLTGNGTNSRCDGVIPVPNCYQASTEDPNKCKQCKRGFYLTRTFRCRKLKIKHCMSGMEINGQIYCSLCDGTNLGNDFQSCHHGDKPENCMSGNVQGIGCLLCKPGFYPETFSRKCRKNELTGCGIYDNKTNCIECETFHGYYAVDSNNRNGRVFQAECKFLGWILDRVMVWVGVALSLLGWLNFLG